MTAGFWGCVWSGGTIALERTSPRMNAAKYCDILEDVLLPHLTALFGEGTPVLFMHDNASIHTARMTQQWFADHPHITALPWPPLSPDLNPIEDVWAMMAREWQPQNERTVAALERHVRDVWGSVERRPGIIRRVVESMPRRLEAVIAARGGYTKY